MTHVIEASAIVDAVARDRVPASDEFVEKCIALLAAVGEPRKARVLARDTDAGMPHHELQEACLAFAEAKFSDGCDPLVGRQYHSSSASPPQRPPPRPPPLRPPILALEPP
jgi:hypothetical protein